MFKFINKVIKVLVVSDFFLNCGWGLIGPIFALFIVQNITVGNTIEATKIAGFASLFYWIPKSILQIPIGRYLDKNHGEKDDFWFMVIGTFLAALVPFGYLFSSSPWHIYGLQILHAIGMAMSYPSWLAIFTRHIDKGKEAFEWSLEMTFIGIGAGIAGALGGILASSFGFKIIFILIGVFTLLSTGFLLLIRDNISPKTKPSIRFPSPHSPYENINL